MTKQDRAKMWSRAERFFHEGEAITLSDAECFAAREVTRAVRAERKAQRDTEELWASHRRRAEEQVVERAKGLGRKRT